MAEDEAERLRLRVTDLESELTRMQAEKTGRVPGDVDRTRDRGQDLDVLAAPSDLLAPPMVDPRSEPELEPGAGATLTVSASMHQGTVDAVRAKAGKRGFSRYVEAAVLRQIRRDNLREILDDFERVTGPADQAAVEEARAFLRGESVQRDLAS